MTVLVVEDNAGIREAIVELLGALGYPVLDAENGKQALSTMTRTHKIVKLVLTDFRLPDMSALELLRSIREISPNCQTVIMSGYSKEDVSDDLELHGIVEWIQKPFTTQDLVDTVARVWDE